ncbi:MAG: DUF4127 family protein [Candidatus Bruticola sp.]
MSSLLLLPLDDRPCCWQFPQRLAEIVGCSLLLPPDSYWRGEDKRCPERANHYALALVNWLSTAAASVGADLAGCIVSADALFYGGLVSSRCPVELAGLEPIAQRFWHESRLWPLLLFSSVMRAAPTQYTASEVSAALRLTELSRQVAIQFAELSRRCPAKTRSEIEQEVLSRCSWAEAYQLEPAFLSKYLELRRRKDLANRSLLASWLKAADRLSEHEAAASFSKQRVLSNLRYLVFGFDDSKTAGFNLWEAKFLREHANGVPSVSFGAGTDETAMLLLARALSPGCRLEIVWSHNEGSAQIGLYEGQNLAAVLAAQAQWLGAELLSAGQGDSRTAQVFIYAPWQQQFEAAEQDDRSADLPEPLWSKWKASLRQSLEEGRAVFVADLAYANGGSLQLVNWLMESGCLAKLCGYSGWNTLGNSLGTVLAWAAAVSSQQQPFVAPSEPIAAAPLRCRRFLLERLLDDCFYQVLIRPRLSVKAGGTFVIMSEVSARRYEVEIEAELTVYLQKLLNCLHEEAAAWHLRVSLPWRRLFEIEIELTKAAGS